MVFRFLKRCTKTTQKYVTEPVHSLKASNIYSLALYKKMFADLWIINTVESEDETLKACTQLFNILNFAGINKGPHKKMHSTMILMNS